MLDRVNQTLTRSRAVRRLLEQERYAMRILTSSAGVVEPRAVACVQALIEDEITAGRYEPPVDPATLAYALIRLRHAFLYHDTMVGIRGDHARLREVQAALLGDCAGAAAWSHRALNHYGRDAFTPSSSAAASSSPAGSAARPPKAARHSRPHGATESAEAALDPARPQQHRRDQHEAVDRDREVVRDVRRERERVREVGGPVREEHEQRGSPDRTDERTQPADHDAGEQRERQLERKRTR